MQTVDHNAMKIPTNKTVAFLKRSFFFALLYASLLYTLVRIIFFEFPFTVAEGFELHGRILLVVWIFLISCKLAFGLIVLVEGNINNWKFAMAHYSPAFKKSIVILLVALLAYAGKTQIRAAGKPNQAVHANTNP